MPGWLVEECEKRYTPPPETLGVDVNALGVPSIPELLEATGWALQSSNGNGVTYWTRPGKPDGTSAVHNHLGTDTLKVFSTAPECSGMTTEGTHNRLSVYAHLCHGGDFGAALKALTFKKLGKKATTDVPEPGDGVFLVRASDVTVEDVEWFDDKLIPLRVVTLVVGLDGVGKSTVLYTKAAKATLGELPGVFYGTPCDVVVASSEDHAGTVIVPRLLAANADLAHVHIVKCRRYGAEGEIALPDDLPAVADVIEEVGARVPHRRPVGGAHADERRHAQSPTCSTSARAARTYRRMATARCRCCRPFQRCTVNRRPVPYFRLESVEGHSPLRARLRR
jgi:AAA domain